MIHASRSYHRCGKPDRSSHEIDDWMKFHGASIMPLDGLGDGWPDRCYGIRGHNLLVELKTGKGKLRDKQVERAQTWRGQSIKVWRCIEDARACLVALGMCA